MPRLTTADKETIMAMIEAQRAGEREDYDRMSRIFRAIAARHGFAHAWRLEEVALWVCVARDQRERQPEPR